MRTVKCVVSTVVVFGSLLLGVHGYAQQTTTRTTVALAEPIKVIFDTDIGDDVDDAFALALLVSRPEVKILGVTTAWGDTALRARLTARFLASGYGNIPIYAGPKTVSKATFSQARYAMAYPAKDWPDATTFVLDEIRKNPGQITLIAVAPFSNIGALIDRDPATFRKLKRIVLMGGSVRRGYGDLGYPWSTTVKAGPEYNVFSDVASSKKLFAAGVPISMMPLDSTQLKLDEVKRDVLFSHGTPMTDSLTLLYHQWSASTGSPTPTLFDAMAVAATVRPDLCPTTPMHIRIDDEGSTIAEPGEPNADVCLQSDTQKFFDFYLTSVLK
jgi:purine nucleosidase